MSIKEDFTSSDDIANLEDMGVTTEFDIVQTKTTPTVQTFTVFFSEALYNIINTLKFAKGKTSLSGHGDTVIIREFDKKWKAAKHTIGDVTSCMAREILVNTSPKDAGDTKEYLHSAVESFIN